MNNLMSNFSGLALSRMEMKKVKGGQCYYRDGGSISPCSGAEDCKSFIANNWGQNWCCDSCRDASWCQGGGCP